MKPHRHLHRQILSPIHLSSLHSLTPFKKPENLLENLFQWGLSGFVPLVGQQRRHIGVMLGVKTFPCVMLAVCGMLNSKSAVHHAITFREKKIRLVAPALNVAEVGFNLLDFEFSGFVIIAWCTLLEINSGSYFHSSFA